MSTPDAIADTKRWLEVIVIGLNFCPFAKKEFTSNRIRYQVSNASSIEECLVELVAEWRHLDSNPSTATTLRIYPTLFSDFEDYLDFADVCEELLAMEGYEGTYQTATFHPNYRFAGTENDDPSNFTNQAPYPILHLLREDDLTQAIDSHPDPSQIPERNQRYCHSLGLDGLRAILSKSNS